MEKLHQNSLVHQYTRMGREITVSLDKNTSDYDRKKLSDSVLYDRFGAGRVIVTRSNKSTVLYKLDTGTYPTVKIARMLASKREKTVAKKVAPVSRKKTGKKK